MDRPRTTPFTGITLVEGAETSLDLARTQELDIGLRGHDHIHAEQDDREEAPDPVAGELHRSELVGQETNGDAGNEEEQGQAPGAGKPHDRFHHVIGVTALGVPALRIKEHADMVENQQSERPDPQPVEIIAACENRAWV